MNINIRLEGGAGDCLLGHRFACAIKEKYSNARITAYIDSEGKEFQKNLLQILYPSFYKDIIVIPKKKYQKCIIDSQFGQEEYRGAIENVPDDIRLNMETKCDKFYNLHIDALTWMNYDFDWRRYFQFFPKPELPKLVTNEKYVVVQLISNTKNDHGLESWYSTNLINKISEFIKVKIICTKDVESYYRDVNLKNAEILSIGLKDACEVISGAKAMVSIDSGLKYCAYQFGIPTICMSKQVHTPSNPFFTHYIRWMPFPETCFPLHYDYVSLSNIVNNIINDSAYLFLPLSNNIDRDLIRRQYKISSKSIININN